MHPNELHLLGLVMLRVTTFSLFASLLVTALVHVQDQVPLEYPYSKDKHSTLFSDEIWNLDEKPNPNSTDHLVFETVYSLLHHWPNTRMRNGHTIVPGIVPKGTTLYHGTHHKQLPPGPEWTAMDPEYAYYFCWDFWSRAFQDECWFLTLVTTRPLKVVYFDGASSAKLPHGTLDAQDLMIWGETHSDDMDEELKRIQGLCEWVQKFGLDGIVRMGMNFEVMLCDFTSGVRTVSFLNLERPEDTPATKTGSVAFEVINTGSWHNHLPGETRIQLDLARLVSFYDTQLAPSLIPMRVDQERWDHRVGKISSQDILAVRSTVEAYLTSPSGPSSGIDWQTLLQVTVDRFLGRLELVRYLLNAPATTPDDVFDLANKAQAQLRIMLTPYILLSTTPTKRSDAANLDWTVPIYKLCATTHTHTMDAELDSMTHSERLLLQAVRGTTREICRVVTKMWAAGIYAGIDPLLTTKASPDVEDMTRIRGQWAEDLGQLMAWLDWSAWVKCDPECGPEEICYLPTWPIGFPGFPMHPDDGRLFDPGKQHDFSVGIQTVAKEMTSIVEPEPDEWVRPRPKCVRRVKPYEF